MFTVADDCAGDAPPRKPKPFLKRGEGVSKRLTAYKLRDEAAALRKQRACDSSSRPWSVDADDPQQDSSSNNSAEQHKRRTWRSQQQAEAQPQQQQRAQPMHVEPEQAPLRHAAPAGAPAMSSSKAAAQMVEQSSWTTGPNVEDLELEEFRALEREILGDVTTSASHTSTTWQQAQQHSHSHRQPQQQQRQSQQHQSQQQQLLRQQLQEEEEAERQYAEYADQMQQQQQPQQQHDDADLLEPLHEPLQQQSIYPRHASSANGAGGPLQGNNLHDDMGFQDDTEWVDTEFSFADLSLEAQQDQTRAAGQQRAHQQRQQQQQASMLQQRDLSNGAAPVAEHHAGPLAEQPYVRSIFKQQQQQQQSNRPVSSHSRVGTAASRRPQRSGKSPPRAAAAACAAAAAAAEDPDQEMLTITVPAAAVARLEQLDAAQAALQQERVGLRKMRQDLEKAAQQLELQRAAWERDRAAQQTNFEAWKAEETKQLANRRRVLDQQQKAMYKFPTKKDKSALEALEAALENQKADARAAAARHKLTVERLRCQVKTLQDQNNELREEVRWHQTQQLNSTAFAAKDSKAPKRPTVSAQTQTDTILAPALRASHSMQQQADAWTAAAAAVAPAADSTALYAALFGDDDEDFEAVGTGSVADSAQLNGISKLQQKQQQQQLVQRINQSQRASVDAGGLHAVGSSSNGRATGLQQSRGAVAAATAGSYMLSSGSSNGGSAANGWGLETDQQHQQLANNNGDDFSFLQMSGQQQQQMLPSYQATHRDSRNGSPADGGWLVPAGEQHAAAAERSGGGVSSSSTGRQRQKASGLQREVLKEYNYPDGKVEQLYDDGSREVHYVNGSSQVHRVDGSMLVSFGNGDMKRQWPHGRVDYYYAEVSVWQCTHPDGLEVFYYPTGQVEGHFTDGRKEVIFADGAARIVTQDGREHDVTRAMLSAAVLEAPPDLSNL